MIDVLIATTNQGKLAAFRRMLTGLPVRPRSPIDLDVDIAVNEIGTTFAENALLKARAFRDASSMATIADDSGLCVDALNGAPGVHSARFGDLQSPEARNELLLQMLEGVPTKDRDAHFISVIAFAGPDGDEWTVQGVAHGVIAKHPRGSHGFGYDPVFVLPDIGRTFAELTDQEKDPLSHRGKAMDLARSHIQKSVNLLE
jgi:XTP/dITP diphosphohydrolase